MELKRDSFRSMWNNKRLLIVPYGIETRIRRAGTDLQQLLIVPYGIET